MPALPSRQICLIRNPVPSRRGSKVMIQKFDHMLFLVTRSVAWIGMIFLMGAMMVTTVDIILRKVNSEGIFGTVDLVQLMILGAAYLSIPHAFKTKSHVAVTLLTDQMGPRLAGLTAVLGMLLSALFMSAIAWFGYDQAALQQEYGDISITLGLPMIYYWIPVLVGAALSGFVAVFAALQALVLLNEGGAAASVEGGK